ncbi:hypothetical protein [Clostridium vincentii]|uniref:Lipoprotein n=1 Tax=Clostridium vincentii TaxID=52704 RepID=A0A2T0BC11_9CLOT|nr:hypothetical protein [Clostridium vincentii]PRR81347.1 hypothetical protein CLVI_25800 [Clostridium vincentii]
MFKKRFISLVFVTGIALSTFLIGCGTNKTADDISNKPAKPSTNQPAGNTTQPAENSTQPEKDNTGEPGSTSSDIVPN